MKKRKRGFNTKAVKFFVALPIMMLIGLLVAIICREDIENSGTLPRMTVTLYDVSFADLQEGNKETRYYDNTISLRNNGILEQFDDVRFGGHGNFSWWSNKKSYSIKFAHKVDLLGMGNARKWVLITNGTDKSLLRNDTAYYIAKMINEKNPLRGEFVNLTINNNDVGIYYLTKSLTATKEVMRLTDPYGVLVEYDAVYGGGGELFYQTWDDGILEVKDIVAEDNAEVALAVFGEKFDLLEQAAQDHDYVAAEAVADMGSLAEYFLLSEFSGNPDAYYTSHYFYSDGLEDKIHAGPGWDFDAAFGNRNWNWQEWGNEFYAPTSLMVRREYAFGDDRLKISRIMYGLIETPEFYELVCSLYQERLMGKEEEVLGHINERANEIKKDAKKEFDIWKNSDVSEETEYLKWWVEVRFQVFDEVYGDKTKMPTIREIGA